MKIIALKGNDNSGKSETLNIVYQLMLFSSYTQALPGPKHFGVLGNPVNRDFMDILVKDDRRIGFATMGDFATKKDACVADLLAYLLSQGCDTAICACNTRLLGTIKAVEAYPNHQFIDKGVTLTESEERIKNGQDARQIFNMV